MFFFIIFFFIILIIGYFLIIKKEKFKVTPRKPIPVCNNHGTINETKSTPGKLVCDCQTGWSGNLCDRQNSSACNNRGTIIVGENPQKCSCDVGWVGDLCETPNCNSNGTYDNYKKQCVCKDGYFGPNCEYSRKDTCSDNGDVIDDSGTCKCDSQKYYYFPSEDDCKNNKDCDQFFTEVPLFQGDDCYNPIDISIDPINNVPANPPIKSYKNLYNLDSDGNPILPYANQEGLQPNVKQSSLLGQDKGVNDDADYVKICPFDKNISINDNIECATWLENDLIYGNVYVGTVIPQQDPNGCITILNGFKAYSEKLPKKINDDFIRPLDVNRAGTKCKFTTTDKNGNVQNLKINRYRPPLKEKPSSTYINRNPKNKDIPTGQLTYPEATSPYLEGADNYYTEDGIYYDFPLLAAAYNKINPTNKYPDQKSAYVVIGNEIRNDDYCNFNGHYNLLSQSCVCKHGWKGNNCEQIDVNCVNGNIEEDVSNPNFGICICNDGWSGIACDNKIAPKTTTCTPGGDCSQSQQKCSLGDKDYVCYNGKWTDSVKDCFYPQCDTEGQLCVDPAPGSYGKNYICRNGLWTDIAFDCTPGAYCPSNGQLCLKPPGPGVKQYSCNNNTWVETVSDCQGWACNDPYTSPNEVGKICLKGTKGASDGDYVCNKTKDYYGFDFQYKWVKRDSNDYFKPCPPKCNINGTCDPENGRCVCNNGYSGDDCSLKTCPNNCSGNGNCNVTTGICTCNPEYTGLDCSTPVKCVANCTPNCSQQDGCGGYCVGGPTLDNPIPGTIWVDSYNDTMYVGAENGFITISTTGFKIYVEKSGSGAYTTTEYVTGGVPTTDPKYFPFKTLNQSSLNGKIIYYNDDKTYWIRPQQCV